jgi:FdhE protein
VPQEKHDLAQTEKDKEIAYQNYQQLKKSIEEWQEERGNYWAKQLTPSHSLPYFTISTLPLQGVLELAALLLKKSDFNRREISFSQEELEQALNQFLQGYPLEDQELYSSLYMAVSGVLDLARRHLPADVLQMAESALSISCPVCGQTEVLSLLVPPVGKRTLACKLCGHQWEAKRVGCIRCGSEDASQHVYLHSEEHPGVEIAICQECSGSFKEFDLRIKPILDWVWEDVKTLSLDYAAQRWLNEQAQKNGSMQ